MNNFKKKKYFFKNFLFKKESVKNKKNFLCFKK